MNETEQVLKGIGSNVKSVFDLFSGISEASGMGEDAEELALRLNTALVGSNSAIAATALLGLALEKIEQLAVFSTKQEDQKAINALITLLSHPKGLVN